MIKSYDTITKQEKVRYRIPKKVQDLIPIDAIYPDGIFKCGNKYTKGFKFSGL